MIGNEEQTLQMAQYCQAHDLFIVPVLPPAVYPGEERLRVNVTAVHTIEDLKYALNVFREAGIRAGVIKPGGKAEPKVRSAELDTDAVAPAL
jgi:glycine C-acetyltransferase